MKYRRSMPRSRSCLKCSHFNIKDLFCSKFKIKITDKSNAKLCKQYVSNYKDSPRRKRCSRCDNLKYAYSEELRKYAFICIVTKKIKRYTDLVQCDKYIKKLNEERNPKSIIKNT